MGEVRARRRQQAPGEGPATAIQVETGGEKEKLTRHDG
jgi:hypothetical protein